MLINSKNLVLLFITICLFGCSINNFSNSTNENNSTFNEDYDYIINELNKNDILLEYTGGISKYIGYQIYDVDKDSINELYIYRIHDFDKSIYNINNMISKPFIYEAYKIENNEPILFLSGEPRGSSTCDNCYFALNDGQILHLQNSHSAEDITLIDANNNSIKEFHCDYAYVAGNPEHDIYKIDKKDVSEHEYKGFIKDLNNKIGYFPVELNK